MADMSKSDVMVAKTFSARFIMAIMLTSTACLGFLKDKLSDEAFMGLAGAACTAYFMKGTGEESGSSRYSCCSDISWIYNSLVSPVDS